MKKCSDCGIEMIENAKIFGLGDDLSGIFISFVNGKKEVTNLFGKTKRKEIYCKNELKARICPSCGKVEMYINTNDIKK